ncbi:MAG: hypothetical protein IMZ50_15600 [Candidatus Atribacteria bacterium]|nr:hypothetical protein [Candidatus Atribacteria bacterium]
MEQCQRCGEIGDDRRTLWMACFYQMQELGLPFKEEVTPDGITFYTLRVCKSCRGEWMAAIENWFNNVAKPQATGTGVWLRKNGATYEASEAEVAEREAAGQKLVRIKKEIE